MAGATITVCTPLEELFEGFPEEMTERENRDIYPFRVRCACVRARPPRHPYFDMLHDMGAAHIDSILYGGKLRDPSSLTFVFPERWMGVHEQQRFMSQMCKHRQVSEIKRVDLVTSSPLMLSDFLKDQIRICTWDDDDKYEGRL